jgi:hypothetical protein
MENRVSDATLSVCLCAYLSVRVSVCVCMYVVCMSVCVSVCLSVRLCVFLCGWVWVSVPSPEKAPAGDKIERLKE